MPMAVEDNVTVGFGSSHHQDPLESKPIPHVPTPDDLAWADSCLVKDSEVLDSSWDSLKEALLNIVNSEPGPPSFSATETGNGLTEETHQTPKMTVDEITPSDEEMEQNSEHKKLFEDMGDSVSNTSYSGSPFRPNYKEDQSVTVAEDDSGLDLDGLALVAEPSTDDIFKVWDLETPTDEEELVKQLNKALAGSGPTSVSSATPVMSLNSLDDLVAAISDLSLGKISG